MSQGLTKRSVNWSTGSLTKDVASETVSRILSTHEEMNMAVQGNELTSVGEMRQSGEKYA